MKSSLLIVEDDPDVRDSLSEVLRLEGYAVAVAQDGEEGLNKIQNQHFDAALIDLRLPRMNGIDFLRKARESRPRMGCIMMTSFPTASTAVDAMKVGAVDYIAKPINDQELKTLLVRTLESQAPLEEVLVHDSLTGALKIEGTGDSYHHLVGRDGRMQKIFSLIEAIKDTDITVLLKGESGTGKGMIARAIHDADPARSGGPYIEVSCGAIPRELLESELFGHIKGAFTSAIRDRIGRFELADGGTILLDEIDSLPPYLQVKLLRVIQNKVFEMVGDVRTKKVDVRIIAATNRDLEEEIAKGNFREDLYYRLKVITVEVPPLRGRKADIPALAGHFLSRLNARLKRSIVSVSREAMEVLVAYDWPGNVRELENTLEWIAVLADSDVIQLRHLPVDLLQKARNMPPGGVADPSSRNALKGGLKESEKKIILEALEQTGGNRKKAAELLNISRTTLYNKIKEHQLV